ncbi:GntR family transcriptional regulator [Paraburkholderia sp. JHI869]|uniref:GntR family transcriptional regulator n=1 Tax=Paraburkholderia sp. JHI869 TaxID=3112959 RepID=UPI00317DD71B
MSQSSLEQSETQKTGGRTSADGAQRSSSAEIREASKEGARNASSATDRHQAGTTQGRTYDALRAMIQEGKIKPGEKLLESDLARAFEIGRSPARLALAALCDDGLIVPNDGRGYRVPGLEGQDSPEGLGRAAHLEKVDVTAPPQWQSLYEEIERELAMQILYASIRVTEEGIAAHFDISRTVVRGVMARLHSSGLLSKNSGGHWVANQVTPDRIKHLLEIRRLLEPTALLGAVACAPEPLVRAIRGRLADWSTSNRLSGAELYDAEKDLHIDFLSHCPNTEIGLALARTHVLFEPTRWLSNSAVENSGKLLQEALIEHLHVEDAFGEHLEILDMVLQGRAELAAKKLEQHILEAERRWAERFEIVKKMKQPDFPAYFTLA